MESLEAELERARDLDESELADAIETIGFECTRCGKCCKGMDGGEHTATVFPDEIRTLQGAEEYDFRDVQDVTTSPSQGSRDFRDIEAPTTSPPSGSRDWGDVARPMPFGLDEDGTGETFEWALQTDDCGDCTFYTEDDSGTGACTVHDDRPLICETYPFSVEMAGTSQPMGGVVDTEGQVRAHECDGLGLDIDRDHAEELATALKERAIREIAEAIGVRDNYHPVDRDPDETIVYDSEGAKRPDGARYPD